MKCNQSAVIRERQNRKEICTRCFLSLTPFSIYTCAHLALSSGIIVTLHCAIPLALLTHTHTHIAIYYLAPSSPFMTSWDVFLTLSVLPTSACLVESVLHEYAKSADVSRLCKMNELKRIRQEFALNKFLKKSSFDFIKWYLHFPPSSSIFKFISRYNQILNPVIPEILNLAEFVNSYNNFLIRIPSIQL